MRTLLTSYDVKNIIEKIFNGNLALSKKTSVPYENENSEEIVLIDEDDGIQITEDLASYLNITFYNWKNRLIEKNSQLLPYDTWAESLAYSLNEGYALVELLDEETTASQDIDSATKLGRVTFLIQSNKISNLDYYVSKIKNKYLGNPQTIENSFGNKIKAYFMIGSLIYDSEPETMQLGECVTVSLNFSISYLNDALTYNDTTFEISLDNETFYTMPLTKVTWQKIFTNNAVTRASRPDLTGFLAVALCDVKTFAFYDYNKELALAINDLFWRLSAIEIDGVAQSVTDINVPVYIKVTSNGHTYLYHDVIDNIEKVLANNDFTITSLSLKGWGKLS